MLFSRHSMMRKQALRLTELRNQGLGFWTQFRQPSTAGQQGFFDSGIQPSKCAGGVEKLRDSGFHTWKSGDGGESDTFPGCRYFGENGIERRLGSLLAPSAALFSSTADQGWRLKIDPAKVVGVREEEICTVAPQIQVDRVDRTTQAITLLKNVGDESNRLANLTSGTVHQAPNLDLKRLSQVALPDSMKSIILGSLLGHGSLRILKGDNNARFSIRHSHTQEEYFRWKVGALHEVSAQSSVHFGNNKKLFFQSRDLDALTHIHDVTHDHNHLLIRRRWLNHLTPLSLAIWWCDEGSIISNGRKGVLSTDDFDKDSVQLLAQYLETVWKVYAHVGPVRRVRKDRKVSEVSYYRLWFSAEELKKFLRVILPHLPVASMIRKVLLVYKDPKTQLSWISEMKEARPRWSERIDEELANKTKLSRSVPTGGIHSVQL